MTSKPIVMSKYALDTSRMFEKTLNNIESTIPQPTKKVPL